jgi:putative acetyltransferase
VRGFAWAEAEIAPDATLVVAGWRQPQLVVRQCIGSARVVVRDNYHRPVTEGVVIRPERDADHPVIAEVVSAAFVGHPDEVVSFVERIRASEQFIPELALVAEDSSGVIAHVMLSWVGVEGGSRTKILNLTPMSVRPDRQRMGVGARLIRDALGRAEEAGEPAVMVEGVAAYYPRFGFEQASALGFISPHPTIPDDAFMVKRLAGYSPGLAGRIIYPAAFDALGY